MISEGDLYNRVLVHLQRKALKVIAAKLDLAIWCDYVNLETRQERSNASGMKFRAEIERKFAKLEEPDAAPVPNQLLMPPLLVTVTSEGSLVATIYASTCLGCLGMVLGVLWMLSTVGKFEFLRMSKCAKYVLTKR